MIRFRLRRHPEEGDLIAFLHGELPAFERSRIAAHLAGCLRCRGRSDELLISEALLRSELPSFPEAWIAAGRTKLERVAAPCDLPDSTRQILFGSCAAAATCLLVEELLGTAASPG